MSEDMWWLIGLAGFIASLFLISVIGGIVPWLAARRVTKLMAEDSPDPDVREAGETGEEQEPSSPLRFEEHSVDTPMPGGAEVREQYTKRWKELTNEVCTFDVGAGLGFALATVVSGIIYSTLRGFHLVGDLVSSTEASSLQAFLDMSLRGIFGIAFAVFALLRRWLDAPRFTTQDGQLGAPDDDLPGLFIPLIQLSLAGVNPGVGGQGAIRALRRLMAPRHRVWQTFAFIAFGLGFGAVLTWQKGVGLPILVAALVHLTLFLSFDHRLQKERGLRLLVLRVFDIDQNIDFTFRRVLKVWGFFGSFFTVVDSSLANFEQRLFSIRNFLRGMLFLLACVLVVVCVEWLAGMAGSNRANIDRLSISALVVFPLVTGFGYYSLCRNKLAARFIRSDLQLGMMSHKLHDRPRHLSLGFRNLTVFAHRNTWNMTVAEFVSLSDVVLMDLRNWNEDRQGSAWEVNYLLDVMELRRIVFLCDEGNTSAVERLIRQSWAKLREGSPNIESGSRTVNLVVALNPPEERYVQNLVERLVAAAHPPRVTWIEEQAATLEQ